MKINQAICSLLAVPFFTASAWAIGTVGFDTSSFLRNSVTRDTTTTTLFLHPEIHSEGPVVSGSVNLLAYAYITDSGSFTADAKDLYVSTSRALLPRHQVSFGRRQYDWSQADEELQLGLWAPRFLWDPLHPQTVGLTGAFYTYQSKYWRLLAFASPVSVPERGYPIRGEEGRLSSSSPFFTSPPESVQVLGQTIPVRYNIATPPIADILFRPGAAVSLRIGAEEGPWSSISYGVMPIHQTELTAVGVLDPQAFQFNADIYPRFRHHHLLTGEAGFKNDFWGVWGSLTGEAPIGPREKDVSPNQFVNPMGPALVSSAGAYIQPASALKFRAAYLRVREDQPASESVDFELALPSRFPYTQAVLLGGQLDVLKPVSLQTLYTYDIGQASGLLSIDGRIRPRNQGWLLGLGVDLIHSGTGEGRFGEYQGDDRVRGTLAFMF